MAQNFNFNKKAAKFFSTVWNFMRKMLLAVVWCMGKLAIAMVWIFFFIVAILVYNPLTMFFIQLFSPNSAAELCCEGRETLADVVGDWFCNIVKKYCYLANIWPYRWKKYWMTYRGVGEYSVEDQIRYFNEFNCCLARLTEEARKQIWTSQMFSSNLSLFKMFVKEGFLTNERFADLLWRNTFSLIWSYVKTNTPDLMKVAMLLNKALFDDPRLNTSKNTKVAGSSEGMRVVQYVVKRYGLDCALISDMYLYKDVIKSGELELIEKALDVYSQRVFTSNTEGASAEWKAFCENTPEICPEAQMCMDEYQYDVFLATDHHLDASAIVHFFKKASEANDPMVARILKNEPEHGVLNDEIDTIVKSKSILFAALMQQLAA